MPFLVYEVAAAEGTQMAAEASGHCEQHREHGAQFRALFLQVTPPSSREGIERYLASGLIKGIRMCADLER
jgi:exodeoxyribonuclease V alpha subunit